jgi:hypothetical protein
VNPLVTIEQGTQVVITKVVRNQLSSITEKDVGRMFRVESHHMDGRQHNRYVSHVSLRDRAGNRHTAIIDQIALCNPNYEPSGKFMVCIACGATFDETKLKNVRGLKDEKACPVCRTLDCTNS